MKSKNAKFLLRLPQPVLAILSQKVEPKFLLELLHFLSAIIALSAVWLPAGVVAGGVAVYCLIDKQINKRKDDEEEQ